MKSTTTTVIRTGRTLHLVDIENLAATSRLDVATGGVAGPAIRRETGYFSISRTATGTRPRRR